MALLGGQGLEVGGEGIPVAAGVQRRCMDPYPEMLLAGPRACRLARQSGFASGCGDAEQVRIAAEEEAVGDRHWRGDDAFAHGMFAEQLEALPDLRCEHDAVFAGGVEDAVGDDRAGVVGRALAREGIRPEGGTRLRVQADDLAAVSQEVDAALVFGERRHEHADVVAFPGPVSAGDVAGAAEADGVDTGLAGAVVPADRNPRCPAPDPPRSADEGG